MTAGELSRHEDCQDRGGGIQQWEANLLQYKDVNGTKKGEILDPWKVEKGRFRELVLTNEQHIQELVRISDTRGRSREHAKWS